MGALVEEAWELDGIRFGEGTNIHVLAGGLESGEVGLRTQDVARSQADGSMFSRDYLDGPEMQFTLGVQHGYNVWPVIEGLMQAWRADATRATPAAMSVLRYRRHGQTYRMLGRGRKIDVASGPRKNDQFQTITATFQLADPERYLEPEGASSRSLTLPMIAPTSNGGVAPPYRAPWQTLPNTQPRVGEVTVGGVRSAPFRVRVYGPSAGGSLQGFTVSGDGWSFTSSAHLTYGQSALIDTASRTFQRSGVSLGQTLAHGCRLDARLSTGHQFIVFTGNDATGSSRAVVSWNDTVPA